MLPNRWWNALIALCAVFTAGAWQNCWARPEYAAREKLSCMSCHATPWGGGPRNVFGKSYGAHGAEPGKLSGSELFYGDLRLLTYYPTEHVAETRNGVTLMQASASANAMVIEKENGFETRAVATYDISPVGGSRVREGYVRVQLPGSTKSAATHVTAGRFYVPFGLLTDEHRTYTRQQTNMTLNNFDTGLALSSDATSELHFDLAGVNDFRGSGELSNGDLTWGTVANARWNPAGLPFLLGASGNYERTNAAADPYAASIYAVVTLAKLTSNLLNGSLLFERVDAWNWNNPVVNTGAANPGLSAFFIPASNAAYLASVLGARSLGYYAQAKYNFTERLIGFYKLDYLDLDTSAADGRFTRHGVGVEAFLGGNLILNARYEKAYVGRPELRGGRTLAAQDDYFLMLRIWL